MSQPEPRSPIRFRGRSFMAMVLAPAAPLEAWLGDLDALSRRAPAFFAGRPVILDVSALTLDHEALTRLVSDLAARLITVLSIEGAGELGPGLPPPLSGGRAAADIPGPDSPEPAQAAAPVVPARSLLLDAPVRSGQAVLHLEGDITVMGSVASGAEVIAGGSIHVYGTLRGRAIAGAQGNPGARIFCRRFEPELVAIDGLYRTADDLGPGMRGQAVSVRLIDDTISVTPLE